MIVPGGPRHENLQIDKEERLQYSVKHDLCNAGAEDSPETLVFLERLPGRSFLVLPGGFGEEKDQKYYGGPAPRGARDRRQPCPCLRLGLTPQGQDDSLRTARVGVGRSGKGNTVRQGKGRAGNEEIWEESLSLRSAIGSSV